jgi:hypothetical protein
MSNETLELAGLAQVSYGAFGVAGPQRGERALAYVHWFTYTEDPDAGRRWAGGGRRSNAVRISDSQIPPTRDKQRQRLPLANTAGE